MRHPWFGLLVILASCGGKLSDGADGNGIADGQSPTPDGAVTDSHPGDGAIVDGIAGDGSGDGQPPSDGQSGDAATGMACGTELCDTTKKAVCCYPYGPSPNPTCASSPAACWGNSYYCLGTSDCSGGDVCCVTPIGGGFTSDCRPLSNCTTDLLCHSSTDCVGTQNWCDTLEAPPACF
jgi:hypothetical protein